MKLHVLEKLKEFNNKKTLRLCMPGHKGKSIKGKIFSINKYDVTEINGIGIEKAVLSAETDLANILGYDKCRILTDGATCGIFALLYLVKSIGNKILINRNSHKSVYEALKLYNIEPIFVNQEVENGLLKPPSVEDTAKVLEIEPNVVGALFTSPDYYGVEVDEENLARLLHSKGKILLLDKAHGAHLRRVYKREKEFADALVYGAHKTLYTLNQGAVLLSKASIYEKLFEGANIFSTTSPSYPIIASVEFGVKDLYLSSEEKIDRLLLKIKCLKEKLTEQGIKIISNSEPFKLSVDIAEMGFSSDEIEKFLRTQNIYCELNDGKYLVFMFSFYTTEKELNKLQKALIKVIKNKEKFNKKPSNYIDKIQTEKVISYLEAVNSETEKIELKNSENRICAVNVGLFPPCTPLLIAGEKITKQTIRILSSSNNVFGLVDGKIVVVKG